jgi:mono/diheme cytochrome c family protein
MPSPAAASPPPGGAAQPSGARQAATRAELSQRGQRGREVFTKGAQPPCTACHTLADAGSSGVVGPNLNELAPDAQRVTQAVTNGVGAMPSYKDLLSPEQIRDLATYVSEAVKK